MPPDPDKLEQNNSRGIPPGGTSGDTAAQSADQKLRQSANGDNSSTTAHDNTQTTGQTQAPDNRALFMSEFLATAGATTARDTQKETREQPKGSANVAPETIETGLAKLETSLKARGIHTDYLDTVKEDFRKLKEQGKLPADLEPIQAIVDRLNRSSDAGTLTERTSDTMMRMVASSLQGKVLFVTPENVKQTVKRDVFNRENPEYDPKATNCRACTASYIMNESLSEQAMMEEFSRVMEKVESGEMTGERVAIPLENGQPRMTALMFQMNHGEAHVGIAGEKRTERELREWENTRETVPSYIQRGLQEAGFNDVMLTGGPTGTVPKEPGFYVLEHRGNDTSGSVTGHVTVAYVDEQGRASRVDSQHPDQRDIKWPITHAYKVTLNKESVEKSNGTRVTEDDQVEKLKRVINPDGTMRELAFRDGKLTEVTDVDGSVYKRGGDGKWTTERNGQIVDAPFKNAEYLGPEEGFRFTYDKYTATQQPNGTTTFSVPERSVSSGGKTYSLHGSALKPSDVVSEITMQKNGMVDVRFKDNSMLSFKASDESRPKASELLNAEALGKLARGLDGSSTESGGNLDHVIRARIGAEVDRGASPETAILKLVKSGSNGADVEQLSRLAEKMHAAGLPTNPADIAKYEKVMRELKLGEDDITKAKAVVDKAQQHLDSKREIGGKPLNEKQALELAILENTPDPSKPGKLLPTRSALKRLREIEEVRQQVSNSTTTIEVSVSDALAVLNLKEKYPDGMKDTTVKAKPQSKDLEERTATRRALILVQKPGALAAAETMYEKLGGAQSGLTVWDASNISDVPSLRDNPKLAAELYGFVPNLRGEMNYKGTSHSGSYSTTEYLEMAKMLVDEGKEGNHLGKDMERIERAMQLRREEARQARRETQRTAENQTSAEGGTESGTKPEISTGTAGDTTQGTVTDTTSGTGRLAPIDTGNGARLPVEPARIDTYRSQLSQLESLPRQAMLNEMVRSARRTLSADVSRGNRMIYSTGPVVVSESESLKPGQSKLVVSAGGRPVEVKSLDSAGSPAFVTADGTRIPAGQVKIEVQIGKGSTNEQVATEAFVRARELKDLMDGKRAAAPQRESEDAALRQAFKSKSDSAIANSHQTVADRVASLGAFEFESHRTEVSLTASGVKIGNNPEISYETLVKDTLREKRQHLDRLERQKETGETQELNGQIKVLTEQIADLDILAKNMHRPESTAKLMEAIAKNATPQEVERLRAERAANGGRLKAGVARAGGYTLVAAFVANMLCHGSSSTSETPGYAPTY